MTEASGKDISKEALPSHFAPMEQESKEQGVQAKLMNVK